MRTICIAIVLLFFVFELKAQKKEIDVESKIKEVTVFLKGAQVTRKVFANLSVGNTLLKVSGLSPSLDAKSIRIEGSDKYKIISVNSRDNYIETLKSPERVQKLTNLIDDKTDFIAEIENEIKILEEEKDFLRANTKITGTNQPISPSDYKELTRFYNSEMRKLKDSIFSKSRLIKKQQTELIKLKNQKKEYSISEKTYTQEVFISVLALKAVKAELSLSYYVSEASWYPDYDIRVKEVNQPLQLTYNANIQQTTGVDWKDVTIYLSNTSHDNKDTFNGLETSFLKRGNGIEDMLQGRTPGISIVESNGSPGAGNEIIIRGGSSFNKTEPLYVVDGIVKRNIYSLKPEDIASIKVLKDAASTSIYGSRAANGVVLVTTKKAYLPDLTIDENIAIKYKVGESVTILSDEPEVRFAVNNADVDAQYIYKCAPLKSTNVYTTASVANWESLNLLDGKTNLFYQRTFVGQSVINSSNTKDTLEFDLGKEQRVVVKRKNLADFQKDKIIGNKRIVSKAFEIEIRNNKEESVLVKLFDKIPVSTNKQIQVDILEKTEANLNQKDGILTWNLNIKPGETKKLVVQYEVKYPKNGV